ncbi:hypothetical protein GGR50DRAFT_671467 [Xylaria sp. CBS 124048]|nr:hypothetical protein GGR50DRAFT_671467 [Xylaria sp. CBS 124048]
MATRTSGASGALTNLPVTRNMASEGEPGPEQPYSLALFRLEPLQPILAGLAHRNHNQHRRSAWWRYFGMLRRNCGRLAQHLTTAIAAARKSAVREAKLTKAKGKKRRREELAAAELRAGTETEADRVDVLQGAKPMVDASVAAHVGWLRDILVPKCYLAFSQLTADTQFAPLGVVLLGVLAEVQAVCECAAPAPAPTALSLSLSSDQNAPARAEVDLTTKTATTITRDPDDLAALAVSQSKSQTTASQGRKDYREDVGQRDGARAAGKSVSREEVERTRRQLQNGKAGTGNGEKDKRDAERTTGTNHATTTFSSPMTGSSVPLASQDLLAGDVSRREDKPPPAKRIKTVSTAGERQGDGGYDSKESDRKKVKRKKVKKGDEFDDLFKGLF